MALSNHLSVRVWQQAGTGDTSINWANTHEVSLTVDSVDIGTAEAIADAFALFHRQFLFQPFRVSHVVVSTYAEDSKPYDPEALYVKGYQLSGLRGGSVANQGVLPLVNVLRLQRETGFGRPGGILLRGYLSESDVLSPELTGLSQLADIGAVQDNVDSAWETLSGTLDNVGAQVCMISGPGNGNVVRPVQKLSVVGLGKKNLRNKVAPRFGGGLLGDIFRAINTVADNPAALEAIKNALMALEWLGPLLAGGA